MATPEDYWKPIKYQEQIDVHPLVHAHTKATADFDISGNFLNYKNRPESNERCLIAQ